MTTWNHRVVREDGQLRIYDVYYDEDGRPVARNESPTYVYGDNVADLRDQLRLMIDCLDRPVLDIDDIGTNREP